MVADVCSCLIKTEDVEYSNNVIKCKSSKSNKNWYIMNIHKFSNKKKGSFLKL